MKYKKVDTERFDTLSKRAEQLNRRMGFHRFHIIRSVEMVGSGAKKNKISVYGMYDSKTKKYCLSQAYVDANLTFDEIEAMLNKATR